MGAGDEVMAAGEAQAIFDADPALGPVAICDHRGVARSHDLWRGNEAIAVPDRSQPNHRHPSTRWVKNAKFCRPYIQYPFTSDTGWTWATNWKARDHRGRIVLSDEDLALGVGLRAEYGSYVLIEPSPVRGNKNRNWPIEKWQAVSDALIAGLGDVALVQGEHAASRLLQGPIRMPHNSFRQACGLLASSVLFIGHEGGLAHAAAALGTPAVVLWGGCVSAEVLGYPEHVNLVDTDPRTPCGMWAPCQHCIEAWERLTPAMVVEAAMSRLAVRV